MVMLVMFPSVFWYVYQRLIIPEINHLGGYRYIIPNGAHCSPEPWNHGLYMIYMGNHPKMAQHVRLVNYYNLPRNMVCWKIHHLVR